MHAEPPTDQAALPGDSPRNAGRRAWLRKGVVAASPVLVSLASAPVHAAGVCVLPSGFISTATFNSRHPGGTPCLVGLGPNYWNNPSNFSVWPTAPAPNTQTSLFSDIFFGSLESGMAGLTVKQVLNGPFTPFAKYCIAGYLNARTNPLSFPLTDIQMVAIWHHYHGGISPLIPLNWGNTDLSLPTAWLQTLMDP